MRPDIWPQLNKSVLLTGCSALNTSPCVSFGSLPTAVMLRSEMALTEPALYQSSCTKLFFDQKLLILPLEPCCLGLKEEAVPCVKASWAKAASALTLGLQNIEYNREQCVYGPGMQLRHRVEQVMVKNGFWKVLLCSPSCPELLCFCRSQPESTGHYMFVGKLTV